MNHNIRVIEVSTKEVYIDINDLIIDLLLKMENAQNDSERKVYKELSDKLSSMRDKAHKIWSKTHS